MKTNNIIGRSIEIFKSIGLFIGLTLVSFLLMGGCKDKKPLVAEEEIPADQVNVPVGYQAETPVWVPATVSPSVRFYFLPEMEIYYDTYMGNYVYWNGTYWVYSSILPPGYFYFDLFNTNVVFLSPGVVYPWRHHRHYLAHYTAHFFGGITFYSHGHGWRFYDEGRGKFWGPHKTIKYKTNYAKHYKNLWGNPGNNKKGMGDHGKNNPFHSRPTKFEKDQNKMFLQSQTPGFKNEPKIKSNQQKVNQSAKGSRSSNGSNIKIKQNSKSQHNTQKSHFTQGSKNRGKKK